MIGRRTASRPIRLKVTGRDSSDWIYQDSHSGDCGVYECNREDGPGAQESDAQAAGPAQVGNVLALSNEKVTTLQLWPGGEKLVTPSVHIGHRREQNPVRARGRSKEVLRMVRLATLRILDAWGVRETFLGSD